MGVDADTSPAGIAGMGKNVLNVLSQGLTKPKPPCFNIDCTACMGLKPGDFVTVTLNVGASANSCVDRSVLFRKFAVKVQVDMCFSGGPLQKLLTPGCS